MYKWSSMMKLKLNFERGVSRVYEALLSSGSVENPEIPCFDSLEKMQFKIYVLIFK